MRRTVRPLAEALFAGESGPAPADRLDWLCDDFDDFVEHAGPRAELVLRGALWLGNYLAPLSIGKTPPLSRLTLDDRVRALERTEESTVGLPLLALKAVLCMIYFEHPDTMKEHRIELGGLQVEGLPIEGMGVEP